MEVIRECLDLIDASRLPEYADLLEELVAVLDSSMRQDLFLILLSRCSHNGSLDAAKVTVLAFDEGDDQSDTSPWITNYFAMTSPLITPELTQLVTRLALSNDIHWDDHILNLTGYLASTEAYRACSRVVEAYAKFEQPSVENVRSIVDECAHRELSGIEYNYDVEEFLMEYLREHNFVSSIPAWVDTANPRSEESIQEECDAIVQECLRQKVRNPEAKLLDAELRDAIATEREGMIVHETDKDSIEFFAEQYNLQRLQGNATLGKHYGPSFSYSRISPLSGESLAKTPSKCDAYGGCRMLLCEGHSFHADADVSIRGEFAGVCDECGIKIPEKHYAVRAPLSSGGWNEWYHSWECVLATDLNHIQRELVNEMIVQVSSARITDRLPKVIEPAKRELITMGSLL